MTFAIRKISAITARITNRMFVTLLFFILKLVVPEGIEPSLGTHLVRTVYKAVGASNYTTGPKLIKAYAQQA